MKLKKEHWTNALFILNLFAKTLLRSRSLGKRALLTLTGIEIKRPSLLLAKLLRLADYEVFLSFDSRQAAKMGVYGRQLFDDPGIFLHLPLMHGYDFSLSNSARNAHLGRQKLTVDFDVFNASGVASADLYFPIMFHPSFLNGESIAQAESLYSDRAMKARNDIGILFAGAFSREHYDKDETRTLFGLLTRYQIIEVVRTAFAGTALYEPTDYESFMKDANAGTLRDKIVICDSDRVRIPESDWFSVLARSAYFLSPPGVLQPFCHNTVESMSVGTVPLLQYPDRYIPQLVHGINCLRFTSQESLIALVGEVLGQVQFPWPELSAASHRYYRDNLSSQAFERRLAEEVLPQGDEWKKNETRKVFICQNQLSVSLYRNRQA